MENDRGFSDMKDKEEKEKRPSEYANELFEQGMSPSDAAEHVLAKYGDRKLEIMIEDVDELNRSHPLGQKETKWKILLLAKQEDCIKVNETGGYLNIMNSTAGEAMCHLMKHGLLQRVEGDDGRSKPYKITSKGKYWLEKAKDYYNLLKKQRALKKKSDTLGGVLRSKVEKPEDDS